MSGATRAVRQRRRRLHPAREVVGVRLHGEDVGIDRQDVAVGDDVLALAGRDVDRLAAETQADRRARRHLVGEKEADADRHRLRFAGRLQVQLDDEIAAGLETPRHAVGRRARRLTGRPAEQVPGGYARPAPSTRVVPARGPASRAGATTACDRRRGWRDERAGIARTELHRPDVARGRRRNRQHEGAKDIGAVGGTRTARACAPRDRVCRAASRRSTSARRERRGIALRRPLAIHCWSDCSSASLRRRASAKSPLPGVRLPRRHHTARGHVGDLRARAAGRRVGDQAERTDLAGPMADRAVGQTSGAISLVNVYDAAARRERGSRPHDKKKPQRRAEIAEQDSPRRSLRDLRGYSCGTCCASIPLWPRTTARHAVQRPRARRFAPRSSRVALRVRLVHVWQIRSAPFFTVLLGDAAATTNGRSESPPATGSAPTCSIRRRSIRTFSASSTRSPATACCSSASCRRWSDRRRACSWGSPAARLFSARAGLVAGLLLAVYAPAIFFDGLIQKSVLDVFFICLSLWLMTPIEPPRLRENASDDNLASASSAALRLTSSARARDGRPEPDARERARLRRRVGLAWTVADADATRRARRPCSSPALALVLAAGRHPQRVVGGGFYLTTSQFGPNFFIGNNPAPTAPTRRCVSVAARRNTSGRMRPNWPSTPPAVTLTPAEVSSYWTDRALDFITTQPGAWLRLMARKVALLCNADRDGRHREPGDAMPSGRGRSGSAAWSGTSACWCRWRCSACS